MANLLIKAPQLGIIDPIVDIFFAKKRIEEKSVLYEKLNEASLYQKVCIVVNVPQRIATLLDLKLKLYYCDSRTKENFVFNVQQNGNEVNIIETKIDTTLKNNEIIYMAIAEVELYTQDKIKMKILEKLSPLNIFMQLTWGVRDFNPEYSSKLIKEFAYKDSYFYRFFGEGKWFRITEPTNIYEIHIDKGCYEKTLEVPNCKKYTYIVLESDRRNIFSLEANNFDLLPFPETGDNWGRFGTRESGGDNWINEEACAGFLGFLYTLKKEMPEYTVYYNDISANDKRNIGHKTHRTGRDIDIRYPGVDNSIGKKLWSASKNYYGSEEDFLEVLENILKIAVDWGFLKEYNYAYKKGVKYTNGGATAVHQDHYHIGFKR